MPMCGVFRWLRFATPSFACLGITSACWSLACNATSTAQTKGADLCRHLALDCERAPKDTPEVSEPRTIVPNQKLPKTVQPQQANNNLDITWFDERLFLAFRTAPTHFASEQTMLYIVSSQDGVSWRYETTVALGRDLREPRFLTVDEQLFLYFAVLGRTMTTFEPGQPQGMRRRKAGDWTEPRPVFDHGFIPWRARVVDGIPTMIGYRTDRDAEPVQSEISLLQTSDGWAFRAAVEDQAVLLTGGGETDFAVTSSGDLITVTRVEGGTVSDGTATELGSRICRYPKGLSSARGKPTCRQDPRKFDSPLLLQNGEQLFLIGRRNVTPSGAYDLGTTTSDNAALTYSAAYWDEPKRCALWWIDQEELTVHWVLDLPSNGDTCFASALQLKDDVWLLYDYSSPLDDPRLSWRAAQVEPTRVYAVTARLPAAAFRLPNGPPPPPRPEGLAEDAGAVLQCGESSCVPQTVSAAGLSIDLESCCHESQCGLSTQVGLLPGFDDLTLESLFGFASSCFPLDGDSAPCGADPTCGCPSHEQVVAPVLGAEQSYRIPLLGCCRPNGACGYRVDLAHSDPELPVEFSFDLGCIDPNDLAEGNGGPALGARCEGIP